MENPKQWSRPEALQVAELLKGMFEPITERIEIVGSLRRGKAFVGDVELLFVPKYREQEDGLFDTVKVDEASEHAAWLLQAGILAKRSSKTGGTAWGLKNMLGVHVASGIPVDLFSTTEENWWVSLVIRTGSKGNESAVDEWGDCQGREFEGLRRRR